MPNRPPIPAEVQREVLIETGHRCAVCGADRPLEFAHIVAWSRSKDHSARNLLCLCASCHQRADTEKWGTKTLRQYKEKPWIRTVRISTGPGGGESEALRPVHQIPPPPADFTGRDAELTELRNAVEAGGATISGVRGMGGVGKTALALKLADELSPLYPDGGIFLDLKGVTAEGQTPLTPSEAMAHVIRAFNPETRLPEGEAELSGLYQTVLHDRRVLLLMDNAAGPSQVAPLSPPRGCLLLVTSRSHFTLPGLVARNLDELPHEDACALLLKIAPRIGNAAGGIARLCDGLPIALRLAGGALAERTDLAPDSYLRRLAGEKERIGLVEGSLKLSVQLLPEEMKGLWCRLAVFPASFDAAATAAVWGLELDPALDSLGTLVKSSLVDGEDGRYRLHDLARLFADSRLDEAGRNESQARHAEHYFKVVAATNDLYQKGGEAILAGLRLFDSEWVNIKAGQRWASSHASQERAVELARDFPYYGAYILFLRQSPQELISWLQAALDSSRKLEDRSREGNVLGNLGLAYAAFGEPHRAIGFHEQDLALAHEIGDRRGQGIALSNLGLAYAALSETGRAIEFYEQHLAIAREIGDRHGEGTALGNLGLAYADLGDPRRAIEFYTQHRTIAREIGDRCGEGKAWSCLGLAYSAVGESSRAIKCHEKHLAIAREIGDRRGQGAALGNMGIAYSNLGEQMRAIELYEQHLAIARELSDQRGEGNALGNMGSACAALGQSHRAIEFYEKHLSIARKIGDRRGEGNALGNMGNIYAALGETRRAIELYELRLAIASEIGDRNAEAVASWNLGLILENQGEMLRAIKLMQGMVDYEHEIGHSDAEADAAHVEAIRARLGGELAPEAQAQLWRSWMEEGPQGPIEDEDEVELP